MDIEEEDRLDTWVGDAESAKAQGTGGIARAILVRACGEGQLVWRRHTVHGTFPAPIFVCHNHLRDFFSTFCRVSQYRPQSSRLSLTPG
jgi:hypothetical protein